MNKRIKKKHKKQLLAKMQEAVHYMEELVTAQRASTSLQMMGFQTEFVTDYAEKLSMLFGCKIKGSIVRSNNNLHDASSVLTQSLPVMSF